MSVATPTVTTASAPRFGAELAVGKRAFGQVARGAIAWALVFGGTMASSALTYVSTFPSAEARHQLLASTNISTGFSVLMGPTGSIDTVGGYTTYKCFVFLTTIGAVRALLASTRLLRGEEDAGRWQLILAGTSRPAALVAATSVALLGAVAVVFVGVALTTVLLGRSADVGFGAADAVAYASSLTIVPAVFVGVGAVLSQLGRTRRMASGVGGAILAVTFVLRMIGDAGPALRWVRWLTPFGWAELIEPLTTNSLAPALPAALVTALLLGMAMFLAARRDVGAGVIAPRDWAPVRPAGLGSPTALAARLEGLSMLAWTAGVGAMGLMLGIIAELTTQAIPEGMGETLERFGVQGTFDRQYFGVCFLLVAAVVSLIGAGQIGAAAEEEASGRLLHILVGPIGRARWLAGRVALATATIAGAGLVAGISTWLGAVSQGVEADALELLGAGANVVPTALLALSCGTVALAFAPRWAGRAVYGVVLLSLLFDLLGSMVSGLTWLGQLSIFHWLALAPAQPVDPAAIAGTLAVASGLVGLALWRFSGRDLQTP